MRRVLSTWLQYVLTWGFVGTKSPDRRRAFGPREKSRNLIHIVHLLELIQPN